MNTFECKETCNLLLYIGVNMKDKDIPHCTKPVELIKKRCDVKYSKCKTDWSTSGVGQRK